VLVFFAARQTSFAASAFMTAILTPTMKSNHVVNHFLSKTCSANGGKLQGIIRLLCGDVRALSCLPVSLPDQAGYVPLAEIPRLTKVLAQPNQPRKSQFGNIVIGEEKLNSNAIEACVCRVRQKVDQRFIKTVRGVGYQLAKL